MNEHQHNELRSTPVTNDPETLKQAILDHLFYTQARPINLATLNDWYMAVAYAVRDRMMQNWINLIHRLYDKDLKIVGYLSAEFLMGPHLGNALINLGIYEEIKKAVEALGLDFQQIIKQEEEPGLGNGGLGRLAACYLDSLTSLKVPAIGYGIRYEFGIFDQQIVDGWQVEKTDKWLRFGNPWEIARPEVRFNVKLGGHTENYVDKGKYRVRWTPEYQVTGVAYDTPVPGYKNGAVNLLRLWKSEAVESFDFTSFNKGDYFGAVNEKVFSETITKVLYPNDESYKGKRLRLTQQYFFVCCSLQDALRLVYMRGRSIEDIADATRLQLNDTHPSIAVAELMRLLVDENDIDWDKAWHITKNTLSYTNHTLLPEALEKWPLPLFASVLPRHLEIIYEINSRFLDEVKTTHPGDDQLLRRVSIIDETGEKYVRMAHLACIGGHAINGVSALHTELLKQDVLHDFYQLSPEKFFNVTNGVTPRRWMKLYNPQLADLITSKIGEGWVTKLETELIQLENYADDADFKQAWWQIKHQNKIQLAQLIQERVGTAIDPDSLFDVQVKRIHEYKRQHLNALHIVSLYSKIKKDPSINIVPRTFIFGGKAAPGYYIAKLIIKLITSIAEIVNNDAEVNGRIKVVFFPDFNVKNSEYIYKAANLSEQISTAGKEASGTGNMKFSLNGALTIGTLDGANVEMLELIGNENFFLFGLKTEEVIAIKRSGYNPYEVYQNNIELKEAIDLLRSGIFSKGNHSLFDPVINDLLTHDPYMVLKDFQSYADRQQQVAAAYNNKDRWTKMSILNVARMGKFSSDRSIKEYCENIWHVKPLQ
ncbi:MAG TPA: glycogen/starch/alpha-glucan phosphorylase [Parafilimonas sp.]|nr:glycogen/starch/alpha-glucan phosphorylase [Parafilimonas sp.]